MSRDIAIYATLFTEADTVIEADESAETVTDPQYAVNVRIGSIGIMMSFEQANDLSWDLTNVVDAHQYDLELQAAKAAKANA